MILKQPNNDQFWRYVLKAARSKLKRGNSLRANYGNERFVIEDLTTGECWDTRCHEDGIDFLPMGGKHVHVR